MMYKTNQLIILLVYLISTSCSIYEPKIRYDGVYKTKQANKIGVVSYYRFYPNGIVIATASFADISTIPITLNMSGKWITIGQYKRIRDSVFIEYPSVLKGHEDDTVQIKGVFISKNKISFMRTQKKYKFPPDSWFEVTFKKMSFPEDYKQPTGCVKFKNGVFKLSDKELGESLIVRDGNNQIEININSNDTAFFEVNWIDDCTYTLTPTQETFKKFNYLPANAKMIVRILQTTDTSYVQTTSSNFNKIKITNQIIKIE